LRRDSPGARIRGYGELRTARIDGWLAGWLSGYESYALLAEDGEGYAEDARRLPSPDAFMLNLKLGPELSNAGRLPKCKLRQYKRVHSEDR
jgi:hypothetical protein